MPRIELEEANDLTESERMSVSTPNPEPEVESEPITELPESATSMEQEPVPPIVWTLTQGYPSTADDGMVSRDSERNPLLEETSMTFTVSLKGTLTLVQYNRLLQVINPDGTIELEF